MKKLKLSIIILSLMLFLGGCSKVQELSEEETDMFAEYISKEVLACDVNYDQALLVQNNDEDDSEELDEVEPNKLVDKKPEGIPVPSEKNEAVVKKEDTVKNETPSKKEYSSKKETSSVNDILAKSKIHVDYKSAKVYNSYPTSGSDYFTITSTEGYQLLVLTFRLTNKSDKKVVYNMLTDSVDFKLTMDSGNSYSPLLTLLVNDLQFMNETIDANSSVDSVLVFRIKDNEVKNNGTLQIENKTQNVSVSIK